MATTIVTSPSKIRDAIRTALSRAPACIAVPFWGCDSVEKLGLDKPKHASTKILCNLSAGGCNPDVIRQLLEKKRQVRALASLHAKVYLGAEAVVVGSANASRDGLGLLEGSGWNEACVLVDDPDAVEQLRDWFDSLWESAADLSDPTIAQILLEQAERAPPALRVDPLDLLNALRTSTEPFNEKDVFIRLDYEPYSEHVERQVIEIQEHLGSDIDAWEDWKEMPPAAEILSFHYDIKTGKTSFQGIYRSPNNPSESMDPESRGIFVSETRRVLGAYAMGDLNVWLEAVKRWQKAVFVNGRANDCDLTLSLSNFATTYLDLPKKR